MPALLDIGPVGQPEVIDLERVSVTTVLRDSRPGQSTVILNRVDGRERSVRGPHIDRVLADLDALRE